MAQWIDVNNVAAGIATVKPILETIEKLEKGTAVGDILDLIDALESPTVYGPVVQLVNRLTGAKPP